jgi:hypothetical protein
VIVAVAICPNPPLLVPSIAAGAAFETARLRAMCDAAVGRLLAAAPDAVVVVGADSRGGLPGFAPGVAGLDGAPELPLSLAIGSWLLDRAASDLRRQLVAVRDDGTPSGDVPDFSGRAGLLVMADGSARRSTKGPGYLDERAAPLDASIVKALATADVETLASLDAALCAELLVAGLGGFKALAAWAAHPRSWRAEILYDEAPYGVQYTVATWMPA